jgi:galactoside O-acetyltransferase
MGIFTKIKQFCFVTLRIWKYKILSDCKQILGHPNCYHPLLLRGKGKIRFGENVQIGVINSPSFYSHYSYIEARNVESEITIGDNVSINNAFSAIAFSKITIGNNVLIGINCSIIDNDGHDLRPDKRTIGLPKTEDVSIEDNVFLGSNVSIVKGVTIGKNAVIGNGSVVTQSVPKNAIAAGNPAKVIRML